jgi:hypothetical protein
MYSSVFTEKTFIFKQKTKKILQALFGNHFGWVRVVECNFLYKIGLKNTKFEFMDNSLKNDVLPMKKLYYYTATDG